MQEPLKDAYCIDTSSLIKLNLFTRSIFETLWGNMEGLVENGRLISPDQVFNELMAKEGKEDEIMKWAKKNKKMFIESDEKTLEKVKEIMAKFPDFVDVEKEMPEADPFVIALSVKKTMAIISEEKSNVSGRPHIPDVCKPYGLRCLDLVEFMHEMGWKF